HHLNYSLDTASSTENCNFHPILLY
ncbi:putative ribonuclease E (RNase E) inhibitor protein, partial [Serratia symbiotica str. Tucson]